MVGGRFTCFCLPFLKLTSYATKFLIFGGQACFLIPMCILATQKKIEANFRQGFMAFDISGKASGFLMDSTDRSTSS